VKVTNQRLGFLDLDQCGGLVDLEDEMILSAENLAALYAILVANYTPSPRMFAESNPGGMGSATGMMSV